MSMGMLGIQNTKIFALLEIIRLIEIHLYAVYGTANVKSTYKDKL